MYSCYKTLGHPIVFAKWFSIVSTAMGLRFMAALPAPEGSESWIYGQPWDRQMGGEAQGGWAGQDKGAGLCHTDLFCRLSALMSI